MTNQYRTSAQARPLRRLLRRRDTQQYFKAGEWTNNAEEAQSFSDVVEVAETCAQQGLSGVEMILRVPGGATDVFCTSIR